jgi:hypothetical protein
MPTIDEKRVYAERTGTQEIYVAGDAGVVVVEVSDDLVGEFSLAANCRPRDVASGEGRVAVATSEAVLVLADGEFVESGFGPAVAVGLDAADLLAADDDGRVARLPPASDAPEETEWTEIGRVEGTVRAIDGALVGTSGGIYRAGADGDEGFEPVGLADVHDVSANGVPLAAAGDGLYKLGNGWMEVLSGDFRVVASDAGFAHAATLDGLYAEAAEWGAVEVPTEEPIRDVDYTPTAAVAVAADGTLLVESETGWRARNVGVGETVGLAVR